MDIRIYAFPPLDIWRNYFLVTTICRPTFILSSKLLPRFAAQLSSPHNFIAPMFLCLLK